VPRIVLTALLALAALAGCQRPSAEQCERICWRYNELAFWERFEVEARNLAPEARDKLRAERQKTWADMKARKFDPGLENCLRECRSGGSPDDVACVERARTEADARECLE
jgi:hypothetical protein